MLVLFKRNRSRTLFTAALALFFASSPAAALRMMVAVHFAPLLVVDGTLVRAKLRMERRTPLQPVDVSRPLVIRKAVAEKALVPFHRDDPDRVELIVRSKLRPPEEGRRPSAESSWILQWGPQPRSYPPPDPLPPAV